jgi:hypothetical protein
MIYLHVAAVLGRVGGKVAVQRPAPLAQHMAMEEKALIGGDGTDPLFKLA